MSEWRTESLASVAEIRSSNVDKKANPGEEEIRLCNYMDVYSNDYITDDIAFMEATATHAEIQRFRVELGDVLLTKDSETPDDIGIPSVVIDGTENLVCGYHLALLKPKKDQVDPVYLAKQLATARSTRHFGRVANGSTRYGLSYKSIADTPIPLAPLPQQQRIAEILSMVDEAIEQTEALIAKTQQIKAGLMHDLFTRGVTPGGQLRPPREEAPQLYKESPLGWIPKEWTSDVAAAYCKNIKVGVVNSATDSYVETGVPFIRSQNVRANIIECADMLFITDSFNLVQKKSILNSGDLVIVRTGYPGTAAVVPDDLAGANCFSLVIAQPDRRLIDPYYMARYMNSDPCKRDIARLQFGSAQHNFNIGEMRKLRLRVPDVDEQARMNLRMKAAEDRIQLHEDERSKLTMIESGLMHDLLTGRVPVAPAAVAGV